MSSRTISIIYLIIIILCFIAMSLCRLPDANGYNVEEIIYTEEKLMFENCSEFKKCIECQDCVSYVDENYGCPYFILPLRKKTTSQASG